MRFGKIFRKKHGGLLKHKSGLGVLARSAFGGINCYSWVRVY